MDKGIKYFKEAVAVWLSGKESEMNVSMETVYKADKLKKPVLNVTGASFYQIFVDGELINYGPARKASGYAAVDIVELPCNIENTEIVIRSIGYNCRSFNCVDSVPYIQAELYDGEKIHAATGRYGFRYYAVPSYLQKVVRYSSQRQFSESWDMNLERVESEISEADIAYKYCERGVPFSEFTEYSAKKVKEEKYITVDELKMPLFQYLVGEQEGIDEFPYDTLEVKQLEEYLKTRITSDGTKKIETWHFNRIEAGFFRIEVKSENGGSFILAFAEQVGADGRPDLKCVDSCNVIKFTVPKGTHTLYSIAPYTTLYNEILYVDGDAEVVSVSVKELAFPKSLIDSFKVEDEEFARIYDAAVCTFRHNSVDIYMDCPSRERAGWLFDSYYTAKAEYELTGDSAVEKEFLYNFLNGGLRDGKNGITEMCYPASVYSKTLVPQWSLWYIQEIYDYVYNRNGAEVKEAFREQIHKILGYFEEYENEYGLLEKLESWNFVEWSELNNRVHDVSWPSNMLYADTLDKVGIMYNREELRSKAEKLKKTITDMAFDGMLFHDRAMREADGLKNTDEFAETTQYYALFFNIVGDDAKYNTIRDLLFEKISVGDIKNHGEVEPSDVMPGLYMKLDMLLQNKEYEILKNFVKEYFGEMAKLTGTLWERKTGITSRDHGFASFVAVVIREMCRSSKTI